MFNTNSSGSTYSPNQLQQIGMVIHLQGGLSVIYYYNANFVLTTLAYYYCAEGLYYNESSAKQSKTKGLRRNSASASKSIIPITCSSESCSEMLHLAIVLTNWLKTN